ncbi:hypothetical protein [Pseudomonas sp. MYb185]|uniref:hypothetical protein n=1 Tax=Pseudomonas sp. MYb185 TaxID=1848729 RepID=UPI000CFE325E|nr:hypothetical protein [Pseudomonas sp. MYb185]
MSTMLIAALVVGGLAIVIGIGFLSQAVERSRLERARALAELQARWSHCASISSELPGQFMSAELKLLLLQVEAGLLERLVRQDGKNARHAGLLAEVRQQLGQGEPRITNAPLVIDNEVAAQTARQQLGDLIRLLEQVRREGGLDNAAFQRWNQELGLHLLQTTLSMHQALANEAMRSGKPRVAKLQYERALSYLGKQQHPAAAGQMVVFRQLMEQAEQAALQMEQSAGNTGTVLSEGVQALEEDDQAWKKKALYDD